jgi:hypothetical protein
MGESDRAVAAILKVLSMPYEAALALSVPLTPALLRLGPCSIRFGMIRAFKNSARRRSRERLELLH